MKRDTSAFFAALRVSRHRETLRGKTTERLRDAILNQFFLPGDRLVERELCELTGVSRTSVREALRHLESQGLVKSVPNSGMVVASLSLEEAQHIYEIREVLEGLAAKLFVERANESHTNLLIEAEKALEKAMLTRDANGTTEALNKFYTILFGGAGNTVAAEFINTLTARMSYLRSTTTRAENVREIKVAIRNYRKIINAIQKKDADQAAACCVAQVRHSADRAREILNQLEAPN